MDELEPISDTVIQLASKSLAYIAGKLLDMPWRLFRDYGYRLTPQSFQMFHLRHPVMVKEHLMVTGLVHPSPPISPVQSNAETNLYSSPSSIPFQAMLETRRGEAEVTDVTTVAANIGAIF
ncbi:hypothetical protein AX14_008491 [Amanita brunnescens Koide BX004]|nr:hypothetical protein AX14_008491 [Amanita brunnescens Koide BX004]